LSENSLPPEALLGQILGGAYLIQSQLDEGGMGLVYQAEHVRLKRPVAVKVMASHLANDANALARFTREAEIISQLHHPHVVQVLDFNTTEDGRPYLVMELLQGRPLDAVMSRHSQLGMGPAVKIAIQAASALSAAHQAGIIHRDLKPANIFLVDTGDELFVKLLDFGISKRTGEQLQEGGRRLTGEFDILGTPEYMAPEQALGRTAAVDARGDQYALAIILYEMLTGRVPFTADDVMELLQRVIRDVPVPPSTLRPELSPQLDHILLRAMSKTPEERFDQITEFAEALEGALESAGASSSPNLGRTTDPALRRAPLHAESPTRNRAPPQTAATKAAGQSNAHRLSPAPNQRLSPTPRGATPTGASVNQEASGQKTTGSHRTSWHSKDPVKAVQGLVDRARQEMGLDNLDLAVSCAESALEISQNLNDPEVSKIISKNARLFHRAFERRLGNLSSIIQVRTEANRAVRLSPEQAFLLSRLDGGLSIEEAIDLSPLSREMTLGQIVGLVRMGHISLNVE